MRDAPPGGGAAARILIQGAGRACVRAHAQERGIKGAHVEGDAHCEGRGEARRVLACVERVVAFWLFAGFKRGLRLLCSPSCLYWCWVGVVGFSVRGWEGVPGSGGCLARSESHLRPPVALVR